MRRILAIGAMLILAGCMAQNTGGLPPNFSVADAPVPSEVLNNLPADVPMSDVLARVNPGDLGPCYFYRYDGKIYPLTTVQMKDAGFDGQPYCVM